MAIDSSKVTPEASTEQPKRRALLLLAGILALVVLVAAIIGLVWLASRPAPPPDDLWAAGSTAPADGCGDDCPVLRAATPTGHGGEDNVEMIIRTDPALDDPIAQWGDCMDSVFACVGFDGPGDEADRANHLRQCVAQSSCPAACRDHFAAEASGDLQSVVEAFQASFLEEASWCSPVR